MKLTQLQELNEIQLEKIEPGAWVTTLIAAIPSILTALNPIIGLFKTTFSEKGELKTKDTSYKWENTPKKSSINEKYYLNF